MSAIDILQDSLLLFDQLYNIFHMNDDIDKFLELDCVENPNDKKTFITILNEFNTEIFLKIFNLLENVKSILKNHDINAKLKEEYMNYIIYYDIINEEFLFIKLHKYIENFILLINLFISIYDRCKSNEFFTSFFTLIKEYPYELEEKINQYKDKSKIFSIRSSMTQVIKTIYGNYYKNLNKANIVLYYDTEVELELEPEPELEKALDLKPEDYKLLIKNPPVTIDIKGGKKSKKMNKIKK